MQGDITDFLESVKTYIDNRFLEIQKNYGVPLLGEWKDIDTSMVSNTELDGQPLFINSTGDFKILEKANVFVIEKGENRYFLECNVGTADFLKVFITEVNKELKALDDRISTITYAGQGALTVPPSTQDLSKLKEYETKL